MLSKFSLPLLPRQVSYLNTIADTPLALFTWRHDAQAWDETEPTWKTFAGLYVVGTTLALLFTTATEPWTIGAYLAIFGTLAVGAVLGGRDWYRSRSSTSTES